MLNQTLDPLQLNCASPDAVASFVARLCQTAGDCGMTLADFHPSRESNEVRRIATDLVRRLDRTMPAMSAADTFRLVDAYDLAHRLAYGQPANGKVLDTYVLRAFDAMLRGDKDVDIYDMFRAIRRAISRRDPAFLDHPLQWMVAVQEEWYRAAVASPSTAGCKSSSGLTDYDIISRTAILLQSDLYAYEGSHQTAFKQALVARYSHYLDHPAASPRHAAALRDLLSACAPYLSPSAYSAYATLLLQPVA